MAALLFNVAYSALYCGLFPIICKTTSSFSFYFFFKLFSYCIHVCFVVFRFTDEVEQNQFNDVSEHKPKQEVARKESLRRVSSRVSQVSKDIFTETTSFNLLWEDLRFSLAVVSNFLVSFVYFVPFIYIPIRSVNLNISNYEVFLSTIGTL